MLCLSRVFLYCFSAMLLKHLDWFPAARVCQCLNLESYKIEINFEINEQYCINVILTVMHVHGGSFTFSALNIVHPKLGVRSRPCCLNTFIPHTGSHWS